MKPPQQRIDTEYSEEIGRDVRKQKLSVVKDSHNSSINNILAEDEHQFDSQHDSSQVKPNPHFGKHVKAPSPEGRESRLSRD